MAWLDDQFGGKEFEWAEDRRDDGIPTLIVSVGAGSGLRRQHIDSVIGWLDTDVAAYLGRVSR